MDAYNLIYGDEDVEGGNNHCCKTPLEELKPIKLCDMKNPMIYKGKYLVCKVIEKPCASFCINVLVMDLNEDSVKLNLYNFRYNLDDVDWISEGDILIVKEPWLQEGQPTIASILVYSPTDVIFVDPTDNKFLDKVGAEQWYESMSTDCEVWRNQANELFKKGKFDKALFLYDRGLRCNPDSPNLYLNKSLTCLKIGAFYAGYEAAKIGLEKGGDREKALFRMGQAAYGMREWQKSAKHFIEVLKDFPTNKLASEELKRATARLCEQRNGKFDFKEMFLEAKKNIKTDLDVSDYKGPVEISNIPGKVRKSFLFSDDQLNEILWARYKLFVKVIGENGKLMKGEVRSGDIDSVAKVIESIKNQSCENFDYYYCYWNTKQPKPTTPSKLIKNDKIQWYLVYDRDGDLAIEINHDLDENDYLLAEMSAEDGFELSDDSKIEICSCF